MAILCDSDRAELLSMTGNYTIANVQQGCIPCKAHTVDNPVAP